MRKLIHILFFQAPTSYETKSLLHARETEFKYSNPDIQISACKLSENNTDIYHLDLQDRPPKAPKRAKVTGAKTTAKRKFGMTQSAASSCHNNTLHPDAARTPRDLTLSRTEGLGVLSLSRTGGLGVMSPESVHQRVD